MRFPFTERDYDELRLISEEYLPIYEDSQDFFSEHYSEIKTYTKWKGSDKEYLSKELLYDEKGMLRSRKMWSQNGHLWNTGTCRVEGQKMILTSEGIETLWIFNAHGHLAEAIYAKGTSYEERMLFSYNQHQQVIGIDQNIEIEWKNGHPFLARDYKKQLVLTHILERKQSHSKILYPTDANKTAQKIPRLLHYDPSGRLLRDEKGPWLKTINYFGYDMMTGKRIIQTLNGTQIRHYYEEEQLIADGIVEVKAEYQEKENSPKTYHRILKTMKAPSNEI